MAFVTGVYLIDAPASALNNGESENNEGKVKSISVPGQGHFPYVSAQSFRYWLRETLSNHFANEWTASPVYTAGSSSKQQAYTEGDPITYPDDDLFGYMRATKEESVMRVSPFRTSTLVSMGPVKLVSDFGVMARVEKEEGDKAGVVLHQHQFYRTILKGLFSIDLSSAGTFTNQLRSGYQNLSKTNIERAVSDGLEQLPDLRAFRLPVEERIRRIQILLSAMGRIQGGAKQTLHYTDVTPVFTMLAVTRGGNNIFGRVANLDEKNYPRINQGVMDEIAHVFKDDLLSNIYVGRSQGFMDSEQQIIESYNLRSLHPRQAFDDLAVALGENPDWMA